MQNPAYLEMRNHNHDYLKVPLNRSPGKTGRAFKRTSQEPDGPGRRIQKSVDDQPYLKPSEVSKEKPQKNYDKLHEDFSEYPQIPVDFTRESPETNPFYYGIRTRIVHDDEGNVRYMFLPLSYDDLFNPEEGDELMQGTRHSVDCIAIYTIIKKIFEKDPEIVVLFDAQYIDRTGTEPHPAADVTAARNLHFDWDKARSYEATKQDEKPFFMLEVVSERYRSSDYDKVKIYESKGIKEYFIVDSREVKEKIEYTIKGYRLVKGKYQDIPADAEGYLHSVTTNTRIGTDREKHSYIVLDSNTGERILPDDEEVKRILAKLKKAEKARKKAKKARKKAEKARKEAEKQARTEAKAREKAEKQARAEAKAREEAEKQARAEAKAREEAEKQARAEAKAREEAENRVKEMAEELTRLRAASNM